MISRLNSNLGIQRYHKIDQDSLDELVESVQSGNETRVRAALVDPKLLTNGRHQQWLLFIVGAVEALVIMQPEYFYLSEVHYKRPFTTKEFEAMRANVKQDLNYDLN